MMHIPHHLTSFRSPSWWHGFTLIELMVVVSIIAILAAIAMPRFNLYLLQGHLDEAKPYLMTIAARERALFNERGFYFTTNNENDLKRELGVDLKGTGNFCFMVRCVNTMNTPCNTWNGNAYQTQTATSDYIALPDANDLAIEFEVWAVLRNSKESTVSTYDGACSVQRDTSTGQVVKPAPFGWFNAASGVGSEGRVVVLRYPPPPDGMDSLDKAQYHTGINHDWLNGISISDVMQE